MDETPLMLLISFDHSNLVGRLDKKYIYIYLWYKYSFKKIILN